MESTELDLGSYYPCLNVENLTESMEFYMKLGFRIREDHRDENWAVLRHNNMVLCLYQGHIDTNLINFRGGDIESIYEKVSKRGVKFTKPAHIEHDGSWSAETIDPDGNVIYFNTYTHERERYVRDRTLIEDK
jgi:predicted lactoylglutathione lyase